MPGRLSGSHVEVPRCLLLQGNEIQRLEIPGEAGALTDTLGTKFRSECNPAWRVVDAVRRGASSCNCNSESCVIVRKLGNNGPRESYVLP